MSLFFRTPSRLWTPPFYTHEPHVGAQMCLLNLPRCIVFPFAHEAGADMLNREGLSTAPIPLSQALVPLTAAASPSGTFSIGGDFVICQGTPCLCTLPHSASWTLSGVVFKWQVHSFLQILHRALHACTLHAALTAVVIRGSAYRCADREVPQVLLDKLRLDLSAVQTPVMTAVCAVSLRVVWLFVAL